MRAPPIMDDPPNAVELMCRAAPLTDDQARDVLRALVKGGWIIAPLEPANPMFEAYIEALGQPATTHRAVLHNIGKARKRWKAMAMAGMKIAFSRLTAT